MALTEMGGGGVREEVGAVVDCQREREEEGCGGRTNTFRYALTVKNKLDLVNQKAISVSEERQQNN